MSIRKVIIHYDYNIATPWRDIALLKLAERVNLFDFPPVCLPGQDVSFNNMSGMVYGWGKTGESFSSDKLLQIQVPIVDWKECEANTHTGNDSDKGQRGQRQQRLARPRVRSPHT